MAISYTAGETKARPGVYQRYSRTGSDPVPGALNGICAIPLQSDWGPLAKVTKVTSVNELREIFGDGDYSATNTVLAAEMMFNGGANTVYVYRMGNDGTAASIQLEKATATPDVKLTALYPGTYALAVSLAESVSAEDVKVLNVYHGTKLVETFEFDGSGTSDGKNLVAAIEEHGSAYIAASLVGDGSGALDSVDVSDGALTGGANPTVDNDEYSAAFHALEPFYYNCIALDVDDDSSISKSLLLSTYIQNAYDGGKHCIGVVGEKSSVALETRMTHAKAFNSMQIVYLGNGYSTAAETYEGALAICYTAGMIAATPANESIVHSVISGGIEPTETLTNAQYSDAILSGMLLFSLSSAGQVWYDSGINTLITTATNQDEGWKKIKRVKVRFELFNRIDRALEPKVGKVACDADGVGDVIQTAQRVIDTMASPSENKLAPGGTFTVDPDLGYGGDSAWFIIQVDDLDMLEKIYLHYKFRYQPE